MMDASMPPLRKSPITVVIACKNAASVLPRCLDGLAAQTMLPHQVILKDALSDDGMGVFPGKYPTLPITVVSGPDSGICDAWNQALDIATGEWVLFLGADDVLHAPDVLERAANALAKVPMGVDIAYGQVLMVDAGGRPIEFLGRPWEEARIGIKHWGGLVLPHQGIFHRRMIFQKAGNFDTTFRIAGDYEFLRRTLPQAPASFLPSLVVTDMRDGGLSGQPKQALHAAMEARRVIRMHGKLEWPTQLITLRCAATYAAGMLLGDSRAISLRQWVKRLFSEHGREGGHA